MHMIPVHSPTAPRVHLRPLIVVLLFLSSLVLSKGPRQVYVQDEQKELSFLVQIEFKMV